MNTYTITLGANTIATISGTEYAYEVYAKTCELADLLGKDVCLVWDDNAEVVAYYDPDAEDYEEPADIDNDCGFDPYEGCYTYDC